MEDHWQGTYKTDYCCVCFSLAIKDLTVLNVCTDHTLS